MKNLFFFSVLTAFIATVNSLTWAGLGQSFNGGCFEEKDLPHYEVMERAKFKTKKEVFSSPTIANDGIVVVGSGDDVYFLNPPLSAEIIPLKEGGIEPEFKNSMQHLSEQNLARIGEPKSRTGNVNVAEDGIMPPGVITKLVILSCKELLGSQTQGRRKRNQNAQVM